MKEEPFVFEARKWASSFLSEHGREETAADWLLEHHLQLSRSQLLAASGEPVARQTWEQFQQDVRIHAAGTPVQHLTGRSSFYDREFHVNANVLIPRMETEELVWYVIDWVQKNKDLKAPRIVDVGTGSGIIAVTLALEIPPARVQAVDIDSRALEMAKQNAARLQAPVTFHQESFLEGMVLRKEKADVVVSNPPYIPKKEWEQLDPLVRDKEPAVALIGEGEEGIHSYEEIVKHAVDILAPGGLLAFEIGWQQGHSVKKAIEKAFPGKMVQVIKDLNGNDRIVTVVNK
ncbi:protein-(glutamine-N5) methyltransferase, release factor-specific [Marinococcus halophilus]|uniref:Release factor glutamine methyltransferase n=1 Tax=Marinococcus halophilus TaxID=1371 RepID=A0A510Y9B2_MARHA|nr:peptide chain release factor N(5)-glutamine methyltransferase [Marinococcus halophilus]OZT81850.1 protein-(glutamine-N5) methyltransferase, release factor-specific [Marinococcus halophilus]GEK59281.1 release factor glutamine methyltransferase [Marinococcus halophilus]